MQNSFFQQFAAWDERSFILTADRVVSYAEAQALISIAFSELRQMDIGPGDRLAIIAENSREYLLLLLACWKAGVVAAPLNIRNPGSLLAEQAAKFTAKRVIASERYLDAAALCECPVAELGTLFNGRASNMSPASYWDEATILFTSGSSGVPKAAVHAFTNHYYSALGSNRNIPVGPGDRWLLTLPLYHVGGLAVIFRTVLGGGAVAIPGPDESLADAIDRAKPTHISLVAAQLYQLMEKECASLSQLRHVLLGGSAISPARIDAAIDGRIRLHTSYGSTEMASQVTTTAAGDPPDRLHSSGRLLNYRQLKIARDREILVRGKTLFKGYWQGKSAAPATDEEGWFHTGDLGELDKNGYLTVTGRKDNLFISGGENIQPEEIEMELKKMTGITEAIVVPIESKQFGRRPAAFLRFAEAQLSEKEIRDQLGKTLPKYKIPDHIFPIPREYLEKGLKLNRAHLTKLAARMLRG